jgi:APA family basic amino acid/polyamine antiporter
MTNLDATAGTTSGTAPGTKPGKPATIKVSATTATGIAVADMIGVGVFTSLGFQVISIQSGFSLLLLWIVGGVVALCGALSYAELGTVYPRSGGEYNFLGRVYHPALGFMAGWLSATVGFAAPIALAAMAFGSYFEGVFPGSPALMLGLGMAWVVALVHLMGLRHSARFQNVSTLLKLVLIAGFIIAGFALGEPQPISFMPQAADTSAILAAPFAVSLVFVMYSYSGWNASTYIISELHDPQRSVPRSLLAASLIVLLLYVGLNAVFLYTTPIAAMSGKLDIALIAGSHIFGEAGGRIVGALICIGLISAISAMTWIGPRVTQVMGEDQPVLKLFAYKTDRGVPAVALIFQLVVTTLLLITQTFQSVVEFLSFAITLSSFLAVLGVLVLRHTKPHIERPYRTWGYPVTPIIFLLVTGYMMYYLLVERTAESLAGLAVMASGIVVYFLTRKSSAG